jgi:hypothetical protein
VRLPRPRSSAPLAVSGFLAFPLFLASLMASSLAIEKPVVIEWRRHGRLIEVQHPPSSSQEAKIWLLALVPPALLVLVGLLASFLGRIGVYAVSLAGVVLAFALTARLDRWAAHHALRFRFGVDLVPDTNPSSTASRGEWEQSARETVLSLSHWTIALAIAAAVIVAALSARRSRAPAPEPPPAAAIAGGTPAVTRPASWRRWVWPRA